MKKVAINGLGRIGRMVLRHYIAQRPMNIEIVAVNDLTSAGDLAYLLRYDSAHGRAQFAISSGSGFLNVADHQLVLTSIKDPAQLPWARLGIEIVLECTGLFRKREDAAKHLQAGAGKIIISAPSKSADLTIVFGVNESKYDSKLHHVVSNASCTTNSLAPAAKVLNDAFGIEHLLATTVHAYTASQALVDRAARKRRRGRAAAVSLIPTSTGAAKATALVIPELEGKMDAIAIRTPVVDGAITDISALLNKKVSVESVNAALKKAAEGDLKGILGYSDDELVSADIIGDPHSGIIDAASTKVLLDRAVKVLVWYDNEFGYARRLLDLADYMAGK
jgi:glyceraldehyde-3-phosphate dehydrogenase type I